MVIGSRFLANFVESIRALPGVIQWALFTILGFYIQEFEDLAEKNIDP